MRGVVGSARRILLGLALGACLLGRGVAPAAEATPTAEETRALRDYARRLAEELEKARAAHAEALDALEQERRRAREVASEALDRDFAREARHLEIVRERERELRAAAARVSSLEARIVESRSTQQRLEAALAQSREARERTEAELASAEAERRRMESALAETRLARERSEAALAESRSTRERTEAELEKTRAAEKQARRSLEESREARKRTEAALTESVAAQKRAETALAESRGARQAAETSLASARDSLTRETTLRREAESVLAAVRSELVERESRIAASDERIASLERTLEESRTALRARDEALRQLDEELAAVKTEGERRIAALESDLRDLSAVHEQSEQLRKLAQKHAARADDLDEKLREAKAAIETADGGDATLRRRVDELVRQLAHEQEAHGAANALAQRLERERDEATARLEQANREHAEALQEGSTRVAEREQQVAAGPPVPAAASGESDPLELERLLALERQHRATLEGELLRLSTSGDLAERYRESWEGLQRARADLLVLNEKLAEERRKREDLEIAVERARTAAAAEGAPADAPLERLIQVASGHERDAEALAGELRRARDEIVRLKGRLETLDAGEDAAPILAELHAENEKLRGSLQSASATIVRLESQAALAKRLAELVYSRGF